MAGKRETGKSTKRTAFWTAAGTVLALWLLLALVWDFYYDLNDDVLMKDILSGLYTGEPETRNIQMLWPVSALLAGLYRLARGFDWYGAFLLLCQFGALFLILWRALAFWERRARSGGIHSISSVLLTAVFTAASLVFLLYHLVFVQYTITVGMLAAAAAFLFLTMPLEENGAADRGGAGRGGRMTAPSETSGAADGDGAAWNGNRTAASEINGAARGYARLLLQNSLPSLLLLWLAYLIRSEMLLLLLPLVLCAALFRVLRLEKPLALYRFGAVALVLAVLGGGLALGEGVSRAAYGSESWRAFYRLFDARTELYDFQPQILGEGYEAHRAFYEKTGVSEEAFALLQNYNYGLDETLGADELGAVAAYAETVRAEAPAARLREALYEYRQWTVGAQGRPYNMLNLLAYALTIAAAAALWLLQRGAEWTGAAPYREVSKEKAAEVQPQGERRSADGKAMAAAVVSKNAARGAVRRAWVGVGYTFFCLALLFAARTTLWLYILYNGRAPERITHSLFLAEFVIAAGLLLYNSKRLAALAAQEAAGQPVGARAARGVAGRQGSADRQVRPRGQAVRAGAARGLAFGGGAALFLAALVCLPPRLAATADEYARRAQVNAVYEEYLAYCAAHPENFYFTDVYSTVAYSEKMFARQTGDAAPANHDLLGGWAYGSPLYEKKLAAFGLTNAAQALLQTGAASGARQNGAASAAEKTGAPKTPEQAAAGEAAAPLHRSPAPAYLIAETGGDLSWLVDYYASVGIAAEPEAVDEIGGTFTVWRIAAAGKEANG